MACHRLSYRGLPPGSFLPHPCWLLSHCSHGSCFVCLGSLVTPTQTEFSFLLGLPCSHATLWKASFPPGNFCFSGRPQLKVAVPTHLPQPPKGSLFRTRRDHVMETALCSFKQSFMEKADTPVCSSLPGSHSRCSAYRAMTIINCCILQKLNKCSYRSSIFSLKGLGSNALVCNN